MKTLCFGELLNVLGEFGGSQKWLSQTVKNLQFSEHFVLQFLLKALHSKPEEVSGKAERMDKLREDFELEKENVPDNRESCQLFTVVDERTTQSHYQRALRLIEELENGNQQALRNSDPLLLVEVNRVLLGSIENSLQEGEEEQSQVLKGLVKTLAQQGHEGEEVRSGLEQILHRNDQLRISTISFLQNVQVGAGPQDLLERIQEFIVEATI